MSIAGFLSIAVVNYHHETVFKIPARECHSTRSRGVDGSSTLSGYIDAIVMVVTSPPKL
jgi:hypothetical protein